MLLFLTLAITNKLSEKLFALFHHFKTDKILSVLYFNLAR